jgi:type I restriction enzyme S subunit
MGIPFRRFHFSSQSNLLQPCQDEKAAANDTLRPCVTSPHKSTSLSLSHPPKSMATTLTTAAQRAIDLLQERRTALISAAVTGQIDVRGAA